MPGARASIGSHLVRPRTPPQMLNARNMSNQRGQPQGDRPGVQREEVKSNERSQPESSSASRPTPSPLNTQQSSPLARTGPPPLPARPPVTPTTPSTSSFSSFFSSKAKSSVSYLASNSKPYRSALAQAGSYVASQAGLIPDRSVRGNAEGNDKEKSWGEWARDWRDRRAQEGKAEESLNLLPGWVVLRPRANYDKTKMSGNTDDDVKPFDLEISTSGFANSLRSPENASRSQRVFMKIAKSFAALPNLPAKIAEDLGGELNISAMPTPGEKKSSLSEEPSQMDLSESATTGIGIGKPRTEAESARSNGMVRNPQLRRSATSMSTASVSSFSSMEASFLNMTQEQLRAFHENLDARLQPFWSSALQRRVQLSIYAVQVPMDKHPRHDMQQGHEVAVEPPDPEEEPLMRNVFTTDAQGLFAQKIVIPWERIISHGPSLPMAFHDPPKFEYSTGELQARTSTWGLYLKAELLSEGGANRLPPSATALQPPSSPSFTTGTLSEGPKPVELDADMWDPGANAFFSPNAVPLHQGSGGPGGGLMNLGATRVVASTWTPIASVGGVRVISDLDDTVKVSNILSGTREVFRNAFCRPVEETEAEGMSELYRHLATQGVAGFHYVSNSPYELLPVLQKFFQHHAFPTGFSLKLKYYGGRNLMNGLFEPPGDRKRPGIIDVMDSFPRAKFVLIGDSGEQDLELYVAIAKQRKDQVLAIAIRDVTTPFTAGLSRFATNTSSSSSLRSEVKTPVRQSSTVSSSEIDLAALSDALAAESSSSGVDQAAKSGVAGRTRDAARRLARKASDLDLSRLKVHRSDSSDDDNDAPLRSGLNPSRRSSGEGSGSSTPRKINHDPLRRHPEDLEEAIADIGAGDDLTPPGTPGFNDNMIVKQTEAEMQELSATQLKLVKRAAEWTDRRYRAQKELPEGIKLLFFQHPVEVEEEIVGVVRAAYGTTPAS